MRKTSSKMTQAACSTQRHWLVTSTPYTDCGQKIPRSMWSSATTTVAGISTRQSR